MIKLTDLERIHLCSYFPELFHTIRNDNLKNIEEIRPLIPLYTLHINYRIDGNKDYTEADRVFTYLHRQKKGKKRVYISIRDDKTKIYMFYISKKRVEQLCHANDHNHWTIDLLGDRWIMVADNYKFQNIYQLINHLIAIEQDPKYENHPPTGCSPDVWMHAEGVVGMISKYRAIHCACHVYEVNLQKFDAL